MIIYASEKLTADMTSAFHEVFIQDEYDYDILPESPEGDDWNALIYVGY